MCLIKVFPRILDLAKVPKALHAKTDENDAITLGSIFADRRENEFLHAVVTFERLQAGKPGTIDRDTTIGELRATTRRNITEGTIDLLALTGVPTERTRAFLDAYARANP